MATAVQEIQAGLAHLNPPPPTLRGVLGIAELHPTIVQHLSFNNVSNLRLALPSVGIDINNDWYTRECDDCIVAVGVTPGNTLDNCNCPLIAGPNAEYCFECRDAAYQRHNMAMKNFQLIMNKTGPVTRARRRRIMFDTRRLNWIRADHAHRDWPTRCPCGNIVKTKDSGWGACPRCLNIKVGVTGTSMTGVLPPRALVFPKGKEALVRENRVRDVVNHHLKFEPMKDFFRSRVPFAWPGRLPFPLGQFYSGILPGSGTQVHHLPFGNPRPTQQLFASQAEWLWGDLLNWV